MRISDWSSDVCSSDLGDDPCLAHATREQDLADAIVDLVRAGVVEFLALEVDFGAVARGRAFAPRLGQPFGIIERAGAADIMFEQIVELGPARSEESRVGKECVSARRSRWGPSH